MKKFLLLIAVFLLSTATTGWSQQGETNTPGRQSYTLGADGLSGGLNAVQAFEKRQERADQLYVAKNYEQAFEAYLELAKVNDKFSQYRLSIMYLQGRGVPKNPAEAYAWSYISAEARQKGFVNNHVHIRNKLTPAQLSAGKALVENYHLQYGTFAMATEAHRLIRKERRQCTGSRVGGSCDRVGAIGRSCGLTGEGLLTRNCWVMGSIGLPGVPSIQPAYLNQMERQLESMIERYNPGFIELGDLEIIED